MKRTIICISARTMTMITILRQAGTSITDQGETLQDYLWSQLVTEDFTEKEKEILRFMLESLDSKGYLTESTEDIARCLSADTKTVERLLYRLQQLDPAGVCARSLEECLKLQLERQQMLTSAHGISY